MLVRLVSGWVRGYHAKNLVGYSFTIKGDLGKGKTTLFLILE